MAKQIEIVVSDQMYLRVEELGRVLDMHPAEVVHRALCRALDNPGWLSAGATNKTDTDWLAMWLRPFSRPELL